MARRDSPPLDSIIVAAARRDMAYRTASPASARCLRHGPGNLVGTIQVTEQQSCARTLRPGRRVSRSAQS
jgi:hypothetical protein